jgi:hypothetical protein
MDNDHEVTPVRENKVQLFLKDNLLSIKQETQQAYNLDEEFARTRKNRDHFVVAIVIAVVALVGILSWFITSKISESSRNVKVDIAVFEDINLKNVLDLAKKAQNTLDAATQDRLDAESNYRADLSSVQIQKKSELDILASRKMSDGDRAAQIQKINAAYAAREKKLSASYKAKLAGIDSQIAAAQKQVQSFDKTRVEEARAQKKMLDNQQDLFELEKKKMKDAYEKELADLRSRNATIENENAKLKTDQVKQLIEEYQGKIATLDPVFGDETAASYIGKVASYDEPSVPFHAAPGAIPDGFGFDSGDFATLRDGYAGLNLLLTKVSGIPYENDVGPYVKSARKIALLAGSEGEAMLKSAFSRIDAERDKRAAAEKELSGVKDDLAQARQEADSLSQSVAVYSRALTDSATANGYDGFVLDMSAPDAPGLFLLPGTLDIVFAADKPEVFVYRAPKTLIATLELAKTDSGFSVAVAKLEKKKEIQAMDYVSVKKK